LTLKNSLFQDIVYCRKVFLSYFDSYKYSLI